MPDSKQDGKKGIEERWPHMSNVQKWMLFGGLCIYAALTAYVPLLFEGEGGGQWGRATIEALTYVLFGAVLIWVLFPSVTDWIQHGTDR